MKPIREWKDQPEQGVFDELPELVEGRGGEPTLKVGRVFLHSRYQPCDEARRLVESAELDRNRPVLVIGLGLGYHIEALQAYGVSELAVVDPDPAVLQIAAQTRLGDAGFPAAVGEPEQLAKDPEFVAFCSRRPQIFIHPATARLHETAVSDLVVCASRAALSGRRLRVAVVGPMYGGSLPIAEYLARAFEKLGHSALFVDNSKAWAIYQDVMDGIETKSAANQLCGLLSNFLNEWSYARTMEFAPDICIVMAQAPVGPKFPLRLAKEGIVSAFWFVENWRHMAYWKDIAPYYDVFFHIQPGEFEDKLSDIGCGCHAFMPTGCDPEVHRPCELTSEERVEYGCDMAFAGAGYFNRIELFKGLTDYDFKIWGVNWDVRELFPHLCYPEERFDAERYARIVAGAKINLNLHSSAYHDGVDPQCDAINPRVFEIAACGGFQLCDPCRNLEQFFDFENELPVYTNLSELREKIDYFLEHPDERDAIAARARARALADHTYEKRAQQMLDLIVEAHGMRILRKGIRVQKTCAEMTEEVGADTDLGRFLVSLPPDMLFTHENLNEQLSRFGRKPSPAEGVFMYLREVREFAEALLDRMP